MGFFFEGIAVVAEQATATDRRLHGIVTTHRERGLVREDETGFSRTLFEQLSAHPIVTIRRAVELLGRSKPAVGMALCILEAAGVIRLLDDRKKNRALLFWGGPRRAGQETELS